MSSINPTKEQFEAFRAHPRDGVIHMINLLKFRDRAAYAAEIDGDPNCSGAEAYQRYGRVAVKSVAAVGGRIVWSGSPELLFIGESGGEDDDWDEVLIVEYPDRDAFLRMMAMPEYQAGLPHRDAGLERTRLIRCAPGAGT